MRLFFLSVFIFLNIAGFSQENPYYKVDSVMRAYKEKIKSDNDLYKTVYFIRKNFDADSLRLRASLIWITENIAYDVKAFQKEDPAASQLSYVIKNKKAVCGGYASLLKYFCDAFNIECEIVDGYGRAGKKYIFINQTLLRSNHAWNAVKLNNFWRLIDPTWAAGFVDDTDEDNMKYQKNFNESYYFSSPDRLIFNHFPKQSRFQLLEKQIPEKDFKRSPLFTTLFVTDQITKVFPDSSLITLKVGDTLTIRFENMLKTDYLCAWTEKIQKANFGGPTKRKGNWHEFVYPVTVAGFYNLYIGYCIPNAFFPLVAYKLQVN